MTLCDDDLAMFLCRPINEEPWVSLPSGAALASWGKEHEVAYNQMHRFAEIARVYRMAFDFLKTNNVQGDYFEFGCHRARTFRIALVEARRQNLEDMRFLAFDSFQGMPAPNPEASITGLGGGALCTTTEEFSRLIQAQGVYADKVETIKGYFQDSLTPALSERLRDEGRRIAVVTVDCDTFESYVPVLSFLEPFLQTGSVVYLRNLFVGHRGDPNHTPAAAFRDFRESSSFQFNEMVNAGFLGSAFVAAPKRSRKNAAI